MDMTWNWIMRDSRKSRFSNSFSRTWFRPRSTMVLITQIISLPFLFYQLCCFMEFNWHVLLYIKTRERNANKNINVKFLVPRVFYEKCVNALGGTLAKKIQKIHFSRGCGEKTAITRLILRFFFFFFNIFISPKTQQCNITVYKKKSTILIGQLERHLYIYKIRRKELFFSGGASPGPESDPI